MATNTWVGKDAVDDSISIAQWGEPKNGDVYNFNGLSGNDTLYLNQNGKTKYNTPFLSAGFTIAPADANGVIVVSGASSGGTKLTFNLTSIETLVFSDKTVTLSYGTPTPPTDTTPPTVSAYNPSSGSTGITVGSDIVITFSEAVQKGTGVIELHSGSTTGTLIASYDAASSTNLTVSGNTLTINPTADLANGTHYFVTLAAGSIKDLAGNNYAGTTAYDFTTVAAPVTVDTTPPTISSYNPVDGATGIAVGSDIIITFSEAVQKGTGVIELHSGSATGTLIASYDAASSTNLAVSGNTLTINPTADLANGTHYFVTLAAGSIKDVAGNNYAGTTAYDFTTVAAPVTVDTTPPTISTYSPVDGATGIAVGSDIVLSFSEAVQRGTGVIELHSGSATGALVASYDAASSTNLTVSGNTLTINPTADLANGTHYFVTLAAGTIKDLAGNNYAGTTAYDFSTSAAVVTGDTTPPTISTYSPADGANGIAVGSDIVLTFSEAVQRGTGLIELHSGSATGALVASYDAASSTNLTVSGNTLTINPTADLANGTHYFVTLAAGSIKDVAGNHYAGTTGYDFSTSAAVVTGDTTPPTISAYSPVDGATGIAVGSDIVLSFSEAVQRGTGLIELHSGSATGALIASYDAASSTNLTVSGNTLTINPTADLANGTHYFVTLAAGSIKDVAGNHYAGTTGYDFSTSAAVVTGDTTPPTISAYSPADGATGIAVDSDIVLSFSEAVQKGTGTIAIHSDSATGPVVASSDDLMTESISISGASLTINPTHDLAYSTHYFVTFGQGSIHDLAGNDFISAMPYDFTTAPILNVDPGTGNNGTEPVLAGVGILGVLAWFII